MIICLGTTPALQRTMQFASLEIGQVNRASHVHTGASGKSINVARVLHTLGHPVLATGFLGGPSGDIIRRDLDQSGISHDFVAVPVPTRTCTTVIDHTHGTATELIEESAPVDADAWSRLDELLKSHLLRATALVLSGTIAGGTGDDFYACCVRLARIHAIPTIVDAAGAALRLALNERPAAIKPNRAELATTIDSTLDAEERGDLAESDLHAAAIGLATLSDWVFITLGPAGAIAADREHLYRAASPPVKAISPIGSGDSFTAAIAIAITTKMNLPNALRLATAAGAANTLTPDPGHLQAADVHRLQPLVGVTTIR